MFLVNIKGKSKTLNRVGEILKQFKMKKVQNLGHFQVEELEQRLEMGRWSASVKGGGTNEFKIKEVSAKYTMRF